MVEIHCHCGNVIESEMNTEIDLAAGQEIYRRIVEGDFMSFSCPECGNEIKTEISMRLKDSTNGLDLQFLPELERSNYLSGQIETNADRVAIGYSELVEKIIIAGARLDDRIIEIIKFRMLEKAENTDISIFLKSAEADKLTFHIHGLKPDQTGISRIPMEVYRKIENELDELLKNEDIKLFTEGRYISVSRVYLED